MKNVISGALAAAVLAGVMPAMAQTAPTATLAPAPATAALAIAATSNQGPSVLPMGTPVTLKMSETLTTKEKKLEPGYLAHLEVMDAVMVNGLIVIPAGSPAMAEITDVRNKGMWGKSGRIGARMLYVTVGDRKIRMRGVFDNKGVTGTADVVAAIAFVPIAGFFTTGTSATLPMGAAVKGYTDEDVTLIMNPVTAASVKPM